MTEGLSHITLIVRDLDRMKTIVETVLGGREVYASRGHGFSIAPEKFFLVGDVWLAVMEGASLSERTYNHIAFKIDPSRLGQARACIEALGLEIREPRPRIEGEGDSIYFYDHDNHLLELHTGSLRERLDRYARQP